VGFKVGRFPVSGKGFHQCLPFSQPGFIAGILKDGGDIQEIIVFVSVKFLYHLRMSKFRNQKKEK
jgi:hypothetical protein